MDPNKARQGSKEKPTYDTTLYLYTSQPLAIGFNAEGLKLNDSSKPKTPTKIPAKAPTTPINKQRLRRLKGKDEGKAMWTQAQENYADDYIRRVGGRCL